MSDVLICPICGCPMRDIISEFNFKSHNYESQWCDTCFIIMRPQDKEVD
jgi:hypothetical protein